ncbi:MAG: hydrolase [Candidatus Marsarchaeota archaeon]|nr:hydrolase [Candidatus Marsarchaeota archaeon]
MNAINIDPKKTALVVIDMQKGIAAMQRPFEPHNSKQVIENVVKLIDKFRSINSTVVLVHVNSHDGQDMLKPIVDSASSWNMGERPKDWSDFIEQIKKLDKDIVITKRQWGAFYGTELDLQLRRRNITTIVLCGISTNIGVETTAREAYQHGYNQIFAIDAMTASSKEEHDTTQKFIFPRIGLIRSTDEVIEMIN